MNKNNDNKILKFPKSSLELEREVEALMVARDLDIDLFIQSDQQDGALTVTIKQWIIFNSFLLL